MFNAKNGRLRLHGAVMDYIVFGKGEKDLVMIPGLGDGLLTARGKALPSTTRPLTSTMLCWAFYRNRREVWRRKRRSR